MWLQTESKLKQLLIKSSGIVLFLLLWELSTLANLVDTQFLPPISIILNELAHLLMSGELVNNLLISLWRITCSLSLAIIAGILLGVLLQGWFPHLVRQMDSLFRLLSHVNPFSLSPLFLLLFGIGEKQKLAIIAIVAFWPVLFYTITGVRYINPAIIKTARSMKVTFAAMFIKVLIPAAFPTIMTGVRISTQLSVFMLTGVEMLNARTGLGAMVHGSAMEFDIPRLYAGGVLIILLGIVLIQIFAEIEREIRFWYEPVKETKQGLHETSTGRVSWHRYWIPLIVGGACSVIVFGSQLVQQQTLQPMPKMGQSSHNSGTDNGMEQHMNMDMHMHDKDHDEQNSDMNQHMDMDKHGQDQDEQSSDMNQHMDMDKHAQDQDEQNSDTNQHMDMGQDDDDDTYSVMLHPSGGTWP